MTCNEDELLHFQDSNENGNDVVSSCGARLLQHNQLSFQPFPCIHLLCTCLLVLIYKVHCNFSCGFPGIPRRNWKCRSFLGGNGYGLGGVLDCLQACVASQLNPHIWFSHKDLNCRSQNDTLNEIKKPSERSFESNSHYHYDDQDWMSGCHPNHI